MATTERDYYVVLGVERTATDAEIKRAYRKLAQQWHPDVNHDPTAHDRFKEINEAYQVLSDPGAARALRHVRAGRRRRRRSRPGFEGFGGFSDIFDAFFGGGAAAAGGADAAGRCRARTSATTCGSRSRRRSRAPRRRSSSRSCCAARRAAAAAPSPARSRRPARSATAAARSARSARRCSARWSTSAPARAAAARAGSSRRRARRAAATAGRSASGRCGSRSRPASTRATRSGCPTRARWVRAAAPPGSLYVAVHVQPHPSLKRDGTELYYEAQVSIAQAALGTKITVPTVDGDEEVEIKAGNPAGHRDPAARQGRAAPRGAAHAATCTCWSTSWCPTKLSQERARAAGRLRGRVRRVGRDRARRHPREARPRLSAAPARGSGPATRSPRRDRRTSVPAPGSSSRSRRTSRPSRRSARSSAGRRPAGRRVEPAFELVDEGLGARVDPTRPATVRAYLPARDRAAAERAVADVAEALGHLQAFGLRPIGELRTRLVHEADWAEAWKAYFPVLRVGRRLVIRPTWRRHRREPDDVVLALDPGMAFGTGLHPTTRLCLAALEGLVGPGPLAGRRVLDVGCGSGILAIAALKLGRASALGVDTDPIADRGHPRQRPAQRRRAPACGRALGSLPSGDPAVRRRPRQPDRRGPGAARARRCATSSGPAACCSHRGSSSTARPRSGRRSKRPGLDVAGRRAEGDWVALEADAAADRPAPLAEPVRAASPYNRGHAVVLPDPAGRARHPGGEPRPAVDPAAVRAPGAPGDRGVGERRRADAAVGAVARERGHRGRAGRHGRRAGAVARLGAAPPALAAGGAVDLRRHARDRALRPAAQPARPDRCPRRCRRRTLARASPDASATCPT